MGKIANNEQLDAALKRLGALFTETGDDWSLRVSVSLTEPTAPIAVIAPDSAGDLMRFAAWGNTLEEAMTASADKCYREMIAGEQVKPTAPFTNPSDHKWHELTETWRRWRDEQNAPKDERG